jgi:septal ring factor EnvC (AmiA/AmiB activator)
MPAWRETETSARGPRKKIGAGLAFDIETKDRLTAHNKLFFVIASAGIGVLAVFVGERLCPWRAQAQVLQAQNDQALHDVHRLERQVDEQKRVLDDQLAVLQAELDDQLAALQAENDVLRRELANARAENNVLRANPTSSSQDSGCSVDSSIVDVTEAT